MPSTPLEAALPYLTHAIAGFNTAALGLGFLKPILAAIVWLAS